ncbi:hypothetical protein F183_A30190 [Bryobacterales bacterium F-183]|nr:hypothetical protein F183_A30190 [Bryobacterales bacterium F-183]
MTVLLFALALGVQSSEAVALNNTAVALAEKGEDVRALPVLRRALYLAPEAIEIAGNLASVQIRVGDAGDAAPLVEWIFSRIQQRPDYRPWAYAVRAELRLFRKDVAGALADARLAVEFAAGLDPFAQAAMRNLRGRAEQDAMLWQDAAEDFKTAVALQGGEESARLAGYLENWAVALRHIKGKGREASRLKRRARAMYRRFVGS